MSPEERAAVHLNQAAFIEAAASSMNVATEV
jgi:hypothetical protein